MFAILKKFHEATTETKCFIVTSVLFIAVLVATTLYCYARLDYVRSYKEGPAKTTERRSKAENISTYKQQ